MRAPGKIEPVVYFVCGDPNVTNPRRPRGFILIAPYTDCPVPDGYSREFAETLAEVDRLETILVRQLREDFEREAQLEESLFSQQRQQIVDDLRARMTSADCDEWEKEFIRLYLQLKDERKRENYRQRYFERTAYLWARHNDTPKNRGVDEEKANVDRISVSNA